MQLPSMTSFSAAAWQLATAHPNQNHWNDAAALALATELSRLAAELEQVEKVLLAAGFAERLLGV